jgi:hypothetical protein
MATYLGAVDAVREDLLHCIIPYVMAGRSQMTLLCMRNELPYAC